MRNIAISKLISQSISRTILILLRPFSWKKWLLLLLIAFLAGALGGGTGTGRSGRSQESEAAPESVFADYSQIKANVCPWLGGISKGLIAPIVLFILLLVIFFTWLSARFQFVWFNAMVNNDASIKQPFARYKQEGNSLFKFLILLGIIGLAFIGMLVAWVYFSVGSFAALQEMASSDLSNLFRILAVPALILIIAIVLFAVIHVFVGHFVVTIMGIDHCRFGSAAKKFMVIGGQNRGDLLLYLLVLFGLKIATAIMSFLIVLICFLAILLVGAFLFGLPYLLLVVVLKALPVFIVFAILLGIPFFLAAFLLLASVQLPFAVFFRTFSLYFLSSLNCGYLPLPLEQPMKE